MELLTTFTQFPILVAITLILVVMVVAKVIKKVVALAMSLAALGMMLIQIL